MAYKKHLFLLLLLSYPSYLSADVYFHAGGGLDYLSHDKSTNDYPLINLKGGVGYKLNENYGLELDFTATSSATYSEEGTCQTTVGTQVLCSRSEEVKRNMIIGSAIYSTKISENNIFFKAGVGIVKSAFSSVYESTEVPPLVLSDEDDSSVVGVISGGIIRGENLNHRMGVVLSTKYGNSDIGNFNFIGFEYNYLFSL